MTTVKLSCKALGLDGIEFDIVHAQNLLQYEASRNISHWQLTPDSGFVFEHGIINRENKGVIEIPGGNGLDKGGKESRRPNKASRENG